MHEREGEWESVEGEAVRDYINHSPSLYLPVASHCFLLHSHSPSLSLSEWSGRQCASTGRESEGEWKWRRRLTTSRA